MPQSYLDASTIPKLREEIDAELATLQARVRFLHSKRNSLSPSYQLPPEILIRIFSHFQSGIISGPYLEEHKYAAWIVILQVSQYWRELVLGSKELWSNIAVGDGIWVENFRERSGTNDLSIDFSLWGFSMCRDLFESAITELHRVSSLTIGVPSSHWEDALSFLRLPAPRLKLLALKPQPGEVGRTNCVVPADIFCGQCPELRHLYIDSFAIDLKAPLFNGSNLSSLSIRSPANAIYMQDICHLLRRLPQLRSLSLCTALTNNGLVHTFTPVYIPNLAFLKLEHRDSGIDMQFLLLITIPETAEVQLKSLTFSQPMSTFEEVMVAMTVEGGYRNPSLVFRDVDVRQSNGGISITCMRNPRPRSGILAAPFVRLEIEASRWGSSLTQYTDRWLHQLSKSFLSPVEVFYLDGPGLSAGTWKRLSHIMLNLRHLILGDPTSFLEHLNTTSLDIVSESHLKGLSDQPIDVDMTFPALRSLTLPLWTAGDAETLCRPIASRKRRGLPLEELTITHMADDLVLRDQVLDMLKDTIPNVRWML
ncbi:hypothetical protein BDN72DRAFT_843456 [Pluteus cervinus]|uniref:Uncharacterized protein n=1 Tax=Pluteus cervinus TaxID=181527 RepID=A0ACD3AN56_9AGAR|nr:hypothetical protein BDN72DRAFT_843456 [Pluteus cervinus]